MSKNPHHENDNGDGVRYARCATITVTMNMETGLVTIGGSVPTNEFGKMLCQAGADEFERRIQKKRAEQLISVAGPDLLENLKAHG